MFRFHWNDLVTDDLLSEMLGDCRDATGEERELAKKAVVRVLKKLGGPPIAHRILTDDECVRLARLLINQPVLRLLTQGHSANAPARFQRKRSEAGPLHRLVKQVETLRVNEASAPEIVQHTGLSGPISEAIVRERAAHGPFESIDDLVDRVRGISLVQRRALRQFVSFRGPRSESSLTSSPPMSETFGGLVRRMQRHLGMRKDTSAADATELRKRMRHRSAIQMAATAMLRASVHQVPWFDQIKAAEATKGSRVPSQAAVSADWLGILPDRTYYSILPSLIDGAKQFIRLCMFHVVYSSERHPTRKLLDSLVLAKQRGVSVKVLMDQDRKTDPYHSLVINTPAKKFFEKNGIECRLDDTSRLLHSKYLVIDDTLVVLGSHNWSAGSYFKYRDLSFAVYSGAFARQVTDRFERQWGRVPN